MLVRPSFTLLLISVLFIHTLYAINPAYYQQHHEEQQLTSLIDALNKHLHDQNSNFDSFEKDQNNDDEEQIIKRNKYPNFHISPLWLSRRTRTNRIYGKPLWISRTG